MARNTRYFVLCGELEKFIRTQTAGSLLPAEQTLADFFHVSKPTLRRAEDELVARGFLIRRNGIGIEIAGNPRGIGRKLIFLCHDICFFAKTVRSFCQTAETANYYSSVVPLSGDRVTQERILETILQQSPSGIAVYADPEFPFLEGFRLIEESRIPVVYLVRLPEGIRGNLIRMRSDRAFCNIVRSFYRNGCRKFALYGDSSVNCLAAAERLKGFLDGLRRCRLKAPPNRICTRAEQNNDFFEGFASSRNRPDAVCCLNDLCAGHFILEARRRSISLDGIAISGFDNLPLNVFLPHPLTTVEQPLTEFGQAAAELLIRQAENPGFAPVQKNMDLKVLSPEFYS